jgi:hypothetical protein
MDATVGGMTINGWRNAARIAAALFVLNGALAFENLWPTPAIVWRGRASIEFAIVLLAGFIAARQAGRPPGRVLSMLSAAWVVLAIGRYLDVTAPALYGREVNLYWDLRFVPDVVAMVTKVAPTWLLSASLLLAAAAVVLLYRLFLWAFSVLTATLPRPAPRRMIGSAAAVLVAVFVLQHLGAMSVVRFSEPVTETYAHQIALVIEGRSGPSSLPPTPDMSSSLERVKGGDVLLVFVESYGIVSYEREMASGLAPARERFAREIDSTGRSVVSAFVESPTFGGSSWLAHLSLLSGVEVRDPDTNALLMTQRRDTLVRAFGRRGFRTIALMPGLRQRWPEGAFYGFDVIYGAEQLAYAGPEFGWFAIPDQFSLAKVDALERSHADACRFVFFPTISTHFPFSPTPPYQPDWSRILTPKPYDGPDIVRAYAAQPDWTNFSRGYVDALAYDFTVLAGYLKQSPERALTMIIIGDHQPAAAVSGQGAPWYVPMHVITKEPTILGRLTRRGFVHGLTPTQTPVARMHELTPILLEAFGS